MPTDSVLMGRPAYEVMGDRVALDRVVQAMCLEQPGLDYLAAIELFQSGWARLRESQGSGTTVAKVLEHAGIASTGVDRNVKLLERRDRVVKVQLDSALAPMRAEAVNEMGEVLLSADADFGKLLANPEERERRLARMRPYEPGYGGDEGRKRFEHDDRLHIESGIDMVRTAERAQELAAAQAKAAQVGDQLDQVLSDQHDAAQRLKQFDTEIARLGEERSRAAGSSSAARPAGGLKILDHAGGAQSSAAPVMLDRELTHDEGMRILERMSTQHESWQDAMGAVLSGAPPASAPVVAAGDTRPAAEIAAETLRMLEAAQHTPIAGVAVPGATRPLIPHSSTTRAGFELGVRAQMAKTGHPWPVAAVAVTKQIAPDVTADELRKAGLLDEPKD